MKYLIISDLHENFSALQGIVREAEHAGGFDAIWFLGDAVGHCENTSVCHVIECLAFLREHNAVCISGNWEKWLLQPELDDVETSFQHPWRDDLRRLRAALPVDLLDWIREWVWQAHYGDFTLTHGSPYKRHDDQYYRAECWETHIRAVDGMIIKTVLRNIPTRHVVVGHTHEPGYFHYNGDIALWVGVTQSDIGREQFMDNFGGRYVINPGSVSNNRGNVPWPTALLLDTRVRSFRFLTLHAAGRIT